MQSKLRNETGFGARDLNKQVCLFFILYRSQNDENFFSLPYLEKVKSYETMQGIDKAFL
jgi:hypothetical protein